MSSLKDLVSSYDVIDSRIILDPKSITASDASQKELHRISGDLDLYLEDFPVPSPDAPAVPLQACDLSVYKRRWYVLVMFGLLNSLQAAVWFQWGPIAATAEHAYGWTDGTIALLFNWGPITFIPTVLLWSWVVDTKGLRVSCVLATALMTLGTGVRCVVKDPPIFTGMVHLGQILNGLAGPVAMGGVPKVSAVWFPPGERTTATTIMSVIVGLGIAAAFFVGPELVPEMKFENCSESINGTRNYSSINESLFCEDDVIAIQRENIMYYNYGTFGICALFFLVMLIYFPSNPPKPPSQSASTPRLNYLVGLKTLAKNGRFWQIAVAYGISTGTRDAWGGMLDVNLKAHGISQSDVSHLGIYASLGGIVAAVALARVADYMKTRHKLFLTILIGLCAIFQLWMVLLIVEILPKSIPSMYVAYGLMDLANASVGPLFYEIACETCFPVSEGITNLSLTTQNNIAALIFLGILGVPDIGTVWMNWLLIGAYTIAFLLLLLLPPVHKRLDIDDRKFK